MAGHEHVTRAHRNVKRTNMRSGIRCRFVIVATALAAAATGAATAQKPPPVRQIGKLERISTDSLASAAAAAIAVERRRVRQRYHGTSRRAVRFDTVARSDRCRHHERDGERVHVRARER